MALRIRREIAWYHLALLGVGSMLLAFFGVGVVLPPNVVVQRSRDVQAPPAVVFRLLTEVRAHERWAPWKAQDPTLTYQWTEAGTGVGGTYRWHGDRARDGAWTTTAVEAPKLLGYALELDGRNEVDGLWELRQFGPVTRVTWELRGHAGWNIATRYMQLGADAMWGPLLDLGLENLKREAEYDANPPKP